MESDFCPVISDWLQEREDKNVGRADNPWNARASPKEELPETRSGWTSRDTDSDSNFSLNLVKLLSSSGEKIWCEGS